MSYVAICTPLPFSSDGFYEQPHGFVQDVFVPVD